MSEYHPTLGTCAALPTDADRIAGLEQDIENYKVACRGFEHGANVAAARISALEAENAALKAELTDTKRKTATLRETNRALMDRAHRRKAQVNKMQRERDALRGDVRKSDYVVALDFRITALEAQVEAAHRAIDSIGLSRCADAHAGVYPDGRITCDDGRPPLSLAERTEWLIRWLSDDPYPMGPRIKALEAENSALMAERDDLLETLTDVTNQACRMSDGTLDSMALSANASAMHALADHGVIVIDADYGRRVIGHYPEVKA